MIDANDLALAHVFGEPPNAIAISDKWLTNSEAETIAHQHSSGNQIWQSYPTCVGQRRRVVMHTKPHAIS